MYETLLFFLLVIMVGPFVGPAFNYLTGFITTEPFPLPDECWDCNKGSCEGCIISKGGDSKCLN
jgi:hypothetical protein